MKTEVNKKLDAVIGCDHDNWGQPHQERAPFHTTYNDMLEKCADAFAADTTMAETLQDGMVNFYPSTQAFSEYSGEDWVPENYDLFPSTSPWKKLDPTKKKAGEMKGRTCDAQMDDGSMWSVTRVGPIITTGCYDWVQVGWNNIFDMKSKLEQYPDGVFITDQFSGPVKRDGTVIGNPPIHIHHIHVDPMNDAGIKQRVDPVQCFQDYRNKCYDSRRVMEHHGDYQCREEDGGLDCLLESVPDGYGKLITTPLQVEGDMNDARACNSEPYEYYYQIGARWVPKVAADGTVSQLKPLNFYNFIGPGNVVFNDQSSLIVTFQVPTAYDSLYWYSGRMPHGGDMLRNKMHIHNKVFKEYILVKATPQELGLTKENNLIPQKAYKTIALSDTRFSTLDEAKAFVLGNLKKSGEDFDTLSDARKREIEQNYNDSDLYSRDRPEAICHTVQDLEEVDGYFYDRKAPTCCVPWHIKKNDIYTVVAFNPKLDYDLGPHTTAVPETFPAHVSLWMSWANEDEPPQSQFGIQMHTQIPSGYLNPQEFPTNMKVATLMNGGTLTHHHVMFYDNYMVATFVGTVLTYPLQVGIFVVIVLVLIVTRCLKSRRKPTTDIPFPHKKQGNSAGKKIVDDDEESRLCPDPEEVVQRVSDAVTSTAEKENIQALKAK